MVFSVKYDHKLTKSRKNENANFGVAFTLRVATDYVYYGQKIIDVAGTSKGACYNCLI
jgi:hypothetical protein